MGLKKKWIALSVAAGLTAFSLNAGARGTGSPADAARAHEVSGTVSVQGTALIANGDTSAARNAAIQDGMKKAVEQSVGAIVSSRAVVDDYKLLNDNLYSNAAAYVRDYKVLDEGVQGTLYTVTIQATVGIKHLQSDLSAIGLLTKQKKRPRVAVVILEQNVGETGAASALFSAGTLSYGGYDIGAVRLNGQAGRMSVAESELTKKLTESGCTVIDDDTLFKAVQQGPESGIRTLDDAAAVRLGKLVNADVILYGKAVAELYGTIAGSEMRSARAEVSLRAIRRDDGKALAFAEKHAASAHIDIVAAGNDAIREAADRIGDSLVASILDAWKQETGGGSLIKVMVNGLQTPGALASLQDTLLSTAGVRDLYESSIGKGQASIEVSYQGDAGGLVRSLLANKSIAPSFEVTSTSVNTVILRKK